MELEEGLFAWANQQTEIAALIGEPAGLRFFKLVIPQQRTTPATVLQRSGTSRSITQCGTIRLASATLQLDHYATTWQAASRLAAVFREVLLEREGMRKYPRNMGTVEVRSATLQNEFDLDDPEPGLYRRSQSWDFWYVE